MSVAAAGILVLLAAEGAVPPIALAAILAVVLTGVIVAERTLIEPHYGPG